jgi:hypothetical protein
MTTITLLQDTIDALKANGKSPEDVEFVKPNKTGNHSWDEFAKYASEISYSPSHNAYDVPRDMVVVGQDWWLARSCGYSWESTSWYFRTLPKR